MKRAFIIITNPIALSVLLMLIVLLFIPSFDKYKIRLEENTTVPVDDELMIYDFDNDGNSEKVHFVINKFDAVSQSIIITSEGEIVDQWNFSEKSLNRHLCFFGDFNKDESHEVYLLFHKNDSVFLIYFEPFADEKIIHRKFILKTKSKLKDLAVSSNGLNDFNNDGNKEIVFTLSEGYSKHPMKYFAYDIVNDNLIHSFQNCFLLYETYMEEVDENANSEVYYNGAAYSNYIDTVMYSEQYAWLVLFDKTFEFLFEPIKIGINPSEVQVIPFMPENETFLACLYKYNGTKDNLFIRLYNLSGEMIQEKLIDNHISLINAHLISKNNTYKELYIICNNANIYEINEDLGLRFITNIGEINSRKPIQIDIDSDGENEFIFSSNNNQRIIITRNDFLHGLTIDIPKGGAEFSFFIFHQEGKSDQLLFKFDQQLFYYTYFENSIYKYRYFIYVGLFAIILFITALIHFLKKNKLEQKYKAERSVTELHIKSLKNQIDPHFTLNIVNMIGSLFEQKETAKAAYLFDKYIQLLKATIQSSDKVFTTLKNELSYVENYLDLEQSRLQFEMKYVIKVDENVDQEIEIPKMLIYTFIENAIKHGIRPLENDGLIEIIIKRDKKNILITIRDNGIGREMASRNETYGAGKGFSIIDQVIILYQKLKNVKISYEIIDIPENKGTILNIIIPLI